MNAANADLYLIEMNEEVIKMFNSIIKEIGGYLVQEKCEIKGVWQDISDMLPKRGDIVAVSRGGYLHFGVFESKKTIFHYSGDTIFVPLKHEVVATTFVTFLEGSNKYLIPRVPFSLPVDAVIMRANSQVGQKSYNLIWNNCEHFAYWCKTGDSSSNQVNAGAGIIEQIINKFIYGGSK